MRSTAKIGAGDRPAPEIVAPLVGSKAALDTWAEDALRNPDSPACAYHWVPRSLVTDGYREIVEGMSLTVLYKGEIRPAVVYGQIRIQQSGWDSFRQTVPVRILVDIDR